MNTRSRLSPAFKKKLEEKLEKNRKPQFLGDYFGSRKDGAHSISLDAKKSVARTSRIKYLPILIVSFIFYYGVYHIFVNVSPDSIANYLLPNTYLPLLVTFFLANFFLFTYIFLNKNFGLLISLFLTTLMFMRLQQVVFEIWWLLALAMFLLSGPALRLTLFREK
jgi:hypothetical protein